MILRLKEVIRQKGISSKELSSKMNLQGTSLSVVSISRIINGSYPSLQTLENIAKAIDVSILELFHMEGYKSIYEKDENGNELHIGFLKIGYSTDTE